MRGRVMRSHALADAIMDRLSKEQPPCASCPRAGHLRLVIIAEAIKEDREWRLHKAAVARKKEVNADD